jgi:hypothetical protein
LVVEMSGNEDYLSSLSHIYIKSTIPGKPVYIAPVASFERNGNLTVITFAAGYKMPNEGFDLTVGPAYLMAFESDELREDWTVDTVFSSSISAIEIVNERSVTLNNLPDMRARVHLEQPPQAVEGLQFWFEASNNCFQTMPRQDSRASPPPQFLQRASAWPAERDIPDIWVDSRKNLDDRIPLLSQQRIPLTPVLKNFRTPSVQPALIGKYSSKYVTWGASFITNCSFNPSWLGSNSAEWQGIPNHLRLPWSAEGWTLFVVASGGVTDLANVDPLQDVVVLSVKDSAGRIVFDWIDRGVDSGLGNNDERYRGYVVFRNLSGTPIAQLRPRSFYGNKTVSRDYPKGTIVAVMRASPTDGLQMWFDGQQYSAQDPVGLWNDTTPVVFQQITTLPSFQDNWFNAFNDQISGFGYVAPAIDPEKQYGKFPGLMAVLSYRRALSFEEINSIGTHLSSTHASQWENIVP